MAMFYRRSFFAILFVVSLLSVFPGAASADEGPFQSGFLGVAAEGYDVVAYFTDGKAMEGNSDFSHEWQDVTWRFSSSANRQLFIVNPAKYAPQYGGYCAYAVSQGYTASIDPKAWSIVDGKLYLNYSKDVKSQWEQNIQGYISDANAQWPTVKKSL